MLARLGNGAVVADRACEFVRRSVFEDLNEQMEDRPKRAFDVFAEGGVEAGDALELIVMRLRGRFRFEEAGQGVRLAGFGIERKMHREAEAAAAVDHAKGDDLERVGVSSLRFFGADHVDDIAVAVGDQVSDGVIQGLANVVESVDGESPRTVDKILRLLFRQRIER